MAGSISLSLSQQFDTLGKPLSGGLLYFIQAGTTSTPQNAYKDTALTLPHPNPIILDSAGRVPAFYLADGQIKIRLTDKNGVQQIVQDNLLVIGPSSGGGGGGGSVDAATIFSTGDLKCAYGTSVLTGWVRSNGRTIGSATSGGTERANSDTQALFVYLWGADANLAVSGGRGASGLADFSANKNIVLPDFRGRALVGLDGMGSSAAGRLTSTYFGTAADVLGASGGAESRTLTAAQLPSSIPYTDPGHPHVGASFEMGNSVGTGDFPPRGVTNTGVFRTVTVPAATTGITINPSGGQAHAVVQPTILITVYLKI
jgi:hypothetical protein